MMSLGILFNSARTDEIPDNYHRTVDKIIFSKNSDRWTEKGGWGRNWFRGRQRGSVWDCSCHLIWFLRLGFQGIILMEIDFWPVAFSAQSTFSTIISALVVNYKHDFSSIYSIHQNSRWVSSSTSHTSTSDVPMLSLIITALTVDLSTNYRVSLLSDDVSSPGKSSLLRDTCTRNIKIISRQHIKARKGSGLDSEESKAYHAISFHLRLLCS